ncbi:MAG: hypothetical protein JSR99_19625 [Proteobacteria bacterium]|nr:hypothetical protein [Pseudomonadota bacterium]
MSAFAIRVLLAAMLVATIAVKVRAAVVPVIDMPAAISRTLGKNGFSPDAGEPARQSMSFSNPTCRLPVKVQTVRLYFGDGISGNRIPEPGYVQNFVYLDREWGSPARFEMREEWLKHRLLVLFGLSPYVPTPIALQIAVPVECPAADAIDWSRVWREEAE